MKWLVTVIFIVLCASSLFIACNYFAHPDNTTSNIKSQKFTLSEVEVSKVYTEQSRSVKSESELVDDQQLTPNIQYSIPNLTTTEQSIINAGLVDIKNIDSTIVVDLKYSTTDNFLGMDVYGDFNKCYLQPDVAEKLKLAQHYLKEQYPYYRLVVYDGARPRSVQRIMWDTVDIPYMERGKFLSSPTGGSLHNFGAAVDISIIDENGYTLDMGTPYDYVGELAYPREEDRLLKEGKLSYKQLLNRELLRSVMNQAGFWGIATEWWHFNSCSRETAYEKYAIIE